MFMILIFILILQQSPTNLTTAFLQLRFTSQTQLRTRLKATKKTLTFSQILQFCFILIVRLGTKKKLSSLCLIDILSVKRDWNLHHFLHDLKRAEMVR